MELRAKNVQNTEVRRSAKRYLRFLNLYIAEYRTLQHQTSLLVCEYFRDNIGKPMNRKRYTYAEENGKKTGSQDHHTHVRHYFEMSGKSRMAAELDKK